MTLPTREERESDPGCMDAWRRQRDLDWAKDE
jgi:hypothetical protein